MGLLNIFSNGFGAIRDIAVPPLCLICEAMIAEPGGACASCWSKIRFVSPPFCAVSGSPFSHDHGYGMVSAEVIANPPPYDRCRSVVIYDDNVRALVTGLKYSDRLDLAPWLANWMFATGGSLLKDADMIIPVPLYRTRLIQRRYNQSSELGRHISKLSDVAFCPDYLTRLRNTKQQVGLTGKERERNVQGAFRVPEGKKPEISGRNILLIDDVYTSGATVKAAARALKRAGSRQVDVLTFARVENVE
jgi:ComF family protein